MDPASKTSTQSTTTPKFSRVHPIAARVLRRWRTLAAGPDARDSDRQTLVACSGGADSIALAAILSLVDPKPTIAHIIHDLRSPAQTTQDRDAAATAAQILGCPFIERSIEIQSLPGNTEHNARAARYAALEQIAAENKLPFVATGHHADDQLETMLMNISRGAGPRGLAGIQDARPLNSATLIRPMLSITHQDAIDLCQLAGLQWTHDHTNDDQSLTRNKIRHAVLPVLRALDPEFATRASTTADHCRSMTTAVSHLVNEHLWTLANHESNAISWSRSALHNQPDGALVELFRQSIQYLVNSTGLDQLTQQATADAVRAIKGQSTEPRRCRVGPIVVLVHASRVTISPSHDQE